MAVSQKQGTGFWGNQLARRYTYFTIGLLVFSIFIGLLESFKILDTTSIGYLFLLLTMAMYAVIGIASRTKKLDEYYVAGRNVPAIANGMATGADWMSAASFISMAGTLWLLGYDGLAYIMGWTGGYVLLALLFAPYMRKFGQFTVPDFVGARYGGSNARVVSSIAAIIVSLTYVTAQVVGVGLIMSRLVGVQFEVGVFVGLAGVLVCSFMGGMKAVTWTQVAQYIILIIAYLIPVTMLSLKLTGVPIPQLMYGQALTNIERLETEQLGKASYTAAFDEPLNNASAISSAQQIGMTPPAAKADNNWVGTPWNFLALMFCLMVGTAGLPHILIRFYTVPSPKESRRSVGYALFFIFLLYFTAPSYAAFSRWEMLQNVVGSPVQGGQVLSKETGQPLAWVNNFARTGLLSITDLNRLEGTDGTKPPAWVKPRFDSGAIAWADANGDGKIQLGAFTAADANDAAKGGTAGELSGTGVNATNADGVLQFRELSINADLVVLATPEIAGLPYTIAALVAAGGLAAALSTADGLLVVISSAIAHDIYYRVINPRASIDRRVMLGKVMLVVAALVAALLALPRLALISQMVAWAFSLAAASFFPIILLGIFWKRANAAGAIAGMIGGLVVTIFYMAMNYIDPTFNILGISHLGAGLFGLITNFVLTIVVSNMTPPPPAEIQQMVENLRRPDRVGTMTEDIAGAGH